MIFCLTFFQKADAQTANARPNIVIILVDDMKWNSISLLNSNNILPTPNINRIGTEGATIKYYSTNALCIPGRASLLSGKYGHTTDAMNNNYISNSVKLLPEILHDNGYYTAQCGKWMLSYPLPHKQYFDYWLYTHDIVSYYNDSCYYFDSVLVNTEHMTDFLTDSAVQLINRIDTPFFLLLSHNAPHKWWIPQTQYDGMFDTSDFDVPLNFSKYTVNYPSFLYDGNNSLVKNVNQEELLLRSYYEMMAGIEESVGEVENALEQNGLMDNTMIIYTTDNSYLIGEHGLDGKRWPYEECMRMPLLIRYPPMFQPNTVLNNNFVLNIDIAPTILSLIGIDDTFQMEGIPIQDYVSGQRERNEFLYEQKSKYPDTIPQLRTFRDNYFQYNKYFCLDTTEELFDMINDPLQKINLVNDSSHKSILIHYRNNLDSLRQVLNDTATIVNCNCYLKFPFFTQNIDSNSGGNIDSVFLIYPNPSFNYIVLLSKIPKKGKAEFYNEMGQKIKEINFDLTSFSQEKIEVADLLRGIYFLKLTCSEETYFLKFVKM